MLRVELWVIIILYIFGFVSTNAQNSPQQKDQILKIGIMQLEPLGQIDEQGKKTGALYDLNKEIAIRTGLKYEIELLPYQRTLEYLNTGQIDIITSAMNVEALAVGDPLVFQFITRWILLIRKSSGFQSVEDLQGKTVVQVGRGISAIYEETFDKIYRVRTFEQALQMLNVRPQIDAIGVAEGMFHYWANQLSLDPQSFDTFPEFDQHTESWIIVNKDMPQQTRDLIKKAGEEVNRDGIYDKLRKKYNLR